ncbi:dynein axonemal assembly factor 11-like isoform X2 [Corticium candelabrum]|uniref:dynein axonemal assembly factor 11-like isoform X2 n=1 Tax=Corticium candelabrum TaxID=121492 RepID=UPI002E276873|nr:dynein axonemal assembly factor 11-like isoform X2 [Corticium candelabrum]
MMADRSPVKICLMRTQIELGTLLGAAAAGCESLQKLDLTVNFVGELTSVDSLNSNEHLREIYLTGNPCSDFDGYRQYVVATLPHLKWLDGKEIEKSERILAMQEYDSVRESILRQQRKYLKKREAEKEEFKKVAESECDIDDSDNKEDVERGSTTQQGNIADETEDDRFWQEKTAYTPESRLETHQQLSHKRKEAEAPKQSLWQIPKREIRLMSEDGRVLNINQGKWDFILNEDDSGQNIVLDVSIQRYLDTSLVDCDVQPGYIKCIIKGKVLQIVLPDAVNPDQSTAKRSQTTGHLVITMPKAKQVVQPQKKEQVQKPRPVMRNQKSLLSDNQQIGHENLEVDPSVASRVDLHSIVNDTLLSHCVKQQESTKTEQEKIAAKNQVKQSEAFVDDPDVPPLI